MLKTKPLTIARAFLLCIVVLLFTLFCGISLKLIIPDLTVESAIWLNIPGILAGIILGIKITGVPPSELFRFKSVSPVTAFATLIGSLGIILLMTELDNYVLNILPMPIEILELFETLIMGSTGFFALVVMAPVTEELFFRGMLLKGFAQKYNTWTAIGMSAFFFGLIHLNPWQFLPAIGAGLFIGWLYLMTDNILLCIAVHALNNGLAYFLEILHITIPGLAYDIREGIQFQPVWMNLSGIILLTGSIILLNKEKADGC